MKESDNITDFELIENSLKGNKKHLEILIERYNDYIFNIAYKMLWNVEDAKDITQEILISFTTKIDGFKFNSTFKTWLYRIAVNHILNYRKSRNRNKEFSFDQYGNNLDNTPDFVLKPKEYNQADNEILFEEVKQTCMSGMLMCLDNRDRMVFIIGEILGFSDKIASEIIEVSPENFRMILSRAKKQLYSFMNNKCGLINKKNPCKCAKKTKSFIEAGHVNPKNLLFYPKHKSYIESISLEKQDEMEGYFYSEYRNLYRNQTLLSNKEFSQELNKILTSKKVKSLFNLN
ncbi:MAG: RNA polymerase sigma factor [Flavobacteriaceae bacterium]